MFQKTAALLICALLALSGCSALTANAETLDDYPAFVRVPLIRQGSTYTCGIACLHSLLLWASADLDINDEYLMESCGTTQANGTSYKRLLQYLTETGAFDAAWHESMTMDQLKSVIDQGGCVMMPLQAWEFTENAAGETVSFTAEGYADYWTGGHWVIACGYNDTSVLFMDPSTGGCYTQLSMDALDVQWHDSPDFTAADQAFTKLEHCGIVVYCPGGATYDDRIVQPLR